MLRIAIHIILTVVVVLSTIGIQIHKYYCSGDAQKTTLQVQKNNACNLANCCHEEVAIYQNTFPYINENLNIKLVSPQFTSSIPEKGTKYIDLQNQFFPSAKNIEPPPLKIQVILAKIQSYLL